MTGPDTSRVVVERDFACPPARLWRALTEPHLIAEWLMRSDFAPVAGREFHFGADWGNVACQVLSVEPPLSLACRWAAFGLDSTVTWTLTATAGGTRLGMEQVGFRPDQRQAFLGAQPAWQGFIVALDGVVAGPGQIAARPSGCGGRKMFGKWYRWRAMQHNLFRRHTASVTVGTCRISPKPPCFIASVPIRFFLSLLFGALIRGEKQADQSQPMP